MSTFVSMVLRHQGVVHRFGVSSGGLRELYEPALYDGHAAAIASFIEETALSPDDFEGLVPFAPWMGGLVVIDVDGQRRWDAQRVRCLNELSLDIDGSWRFAPELQGRGWLGKGLVKPGTHELLAPYPASWGFSWYDAQQALHNKKFDTAFRQKNPGVKDAWTRITQRVAQAPRVPFDPPGWTFSTVDMDDTQGMAALRIALEEAGFKFSSADDEAWQAKITPPVNAT